MIARIGAVAALVVVAGLAQPGDARVVRVPTIPGACPGAPSWTKVAACLKRFGKLKILDSSATAKLVQLSDDDDGEARGYRTAGIYLYAAHNNRWGLGGMHHGGDYSLVALKTFTTGRHTGYRIDLRRTEDHEILLHDRPHQAHVRQTVAVYCSGQSHVCSEVLLACDVYLEGKTYWTFRGTPEISGGRLLVRGDRSTTGAECVQEEESWLPAFAD